MNRAKPVGCSCRHCWLCCLNTFRKVRRMPVLTMEPVPKVSIYLRQSDRLNLLRCWRAAWAASVNPFFIAVLSKTMKITYDHCSKSSWSCLLWIVRWNATFCAFQKAEAGMTFQTLDMVHKPWGGNGLSLEQIHVALKVVSQSRYYIIVPVIWLWKFMTRVNPGLYHRQHADGGWDQWIAALAKHAALYCFVGTGSAHWILEYRVRGACTATHAKLRDLRF